MSKSVYDKNFKGDNAKEKREKALYQALDIRKFEIDLYWKRATYFWGFLIVIFGGYFTVLFTEEKQFKNETLLLISALGTLFSLGWFLVNKGSKFWQNNWERHVDFLEDEFMGPLYKMVITKNVEKKESKLNRLILDESLYSVSKINQALSFYILTIWISLFLGNSVSLSVTDNIKIHNFDITYGHVYLLFTIYSIAFFVYMCFSCKTKLNSQANLKINKRPLK